MAMAPKPKITAKDIAARTALAKKTVKMVEPKIKEVMKSSPKVTKENIAKQALSPKKKALEVKPATVTKKDIAKLMTSPKTKLSDMEKKIKAKPKMNQSEKDFIAGQKKKDQILKKTGKYMNTAN